MKQGDFVKRAGLVLYADGLKRKVSKKTWLVSKVEDGTPFFKDENGNEVALKLPKNEGEYIVVGNEVDGISPEFIAPEGVEGSGGVTQKYRVHGNFSEKGWEDGDIVQISGKVSKETLESGKLELVPNTEPHKHVLVVVDPVLLNNKVQNG